MNKRLEEVSESRRFDVVIATVKSVGGRSIRVYAADMYESGGFGYGEDLDGIILLLATDDRDFAFAATGYGFEAFTDKGQEYLEDVILPYLRDDRYFDAFMAFADAADDYIGAARAGAPYNAGSTPPGYVKPTPNYGGAVAFSFIGALLIAAATTGIWRSQLKSVRGQNFAQAYIRQGSMKLTSSRDVFLYRRVSRTKRAENTGSGGRSGSFSSSSGRSFTGRSGKY